jgi:hypothetical protein
MVRKEELCQTVQLGAAATQGHRGGGEAGCCRRCFLFRIGVPTCRNSKI